LKGAGFSEDDAFSENGENITENTEQMASSQAPLNEKASPETDSDFDVERVFANLQASAESGTVTEISSDLATALEVAREYEKSIASGDVADVSLPAEVKSKMKTFAVSPEFADEIKDLRLPQFVIKSNNPRFYGEKDLLTPEDLYENFSLLGENAKIDFDNVDTEMARVDVDEKSKNVPKAWTYTPWGNSIYREFFDALPPEQKIAKCKEIILNLLAVQDGFSHDGLSEYVDLVIKSLTQEQIEDFKQSPQSYHLRIKKKIESLRAEFTRTEFYDLIRKNKLFCEPMYVFPPTISPSRYTTALPKTLYKAEEDMNGLEKDVAWFLANEPKIKWWHRNISRTGFAINAYILDGCTNAYPDIIAMTTSGKILVIEPKGGHLDGKNSQRKAEIGQEWEKLAGRQYAYFMVFRNKNLDDSTGAVHFDKFKNIVQDMD
jgi:type III restriction enzyme